MELVMKKIVFSFLLSSLHILGAYHSYDALKMDLKQQLYYCQATLMKDYNKYEQFIESYIQEAEESLKIIQYFMRHYNSPLTNDYFMRLRNYNGVSFRYYIKPTVAAKTELDIASEQLFKIIEEIKKDANLSHLNVQQEWQNTIDLLHKANVAYHKKLDLGVRFLLLFAKG
jgi:hypothetical protein